MLTDEQKLYIGIIYEEQGVFPAIAYIRHITGIMDLEMASKYLTTILTECGIERTYNKNTHI